MAKYTSKAAVLTVTQEDAYRNLTDMQAFQERLKGIPQEYLNQIGNIEFTEDSIKFSTPQVGELQFDVVERIPNTKISYQAARTPIPLALAVNISDKDGVAELTSYIDVEIPVMLRPMIGGKMQEAVDKLNDIMCLIAGKQY